MGAGLARVHKIFNVLIVLYVYININKKQAKCPFRAVRPDNPEKLLAPLTPQVGYTLSHFCMV